MIRVAPARPHLRIRPTEGWRALRLVELWEFRDVLWMLALRDIKLRYRRTALGVAWVILQPVVLMETIFRLNLRPVSSALTTRLISCY